MKLTARLLRRDFTAPLDFPDVDLLPVRYSWHRKGGPEFCELRAYGQASALWQLVNWLRSPVEVLDARGTAVWWGYLSEVTVGVGPFELGLSVEYLANRVRVKYSTQEAGGALVEEWTEWAEDLDSVAVFGAFELVAESPKGSLELAVAQRDQLLQELKWPVPVTRPSTPGTTTSGKLVATLRCRGWYFSLAWQYYENAATEAAETTAQLLYLLETSQFVTAADVQDASGVYASQFRDGTERRLQVVEALLAAGVSGGGQFVSVVTRDRVFRVFEEPSAENLYLQADGRLTSVWGSELLNHVCPAGQWVVLRGVVPATVLTSRLADPFRFFVERAEYTVGNGRLVLEPRGGDSPWSAATAKLSAGGFTPFVGRYEGPHAGLFQLKNPDGTWSVFLQVSDTANVPFLSAGERNFKSNTKWLKLGYQNRAHAYLKDPTSDDQDPEEPTDLVVVPCVPFVSVSSNYTATHLDGVVVTTAAVTVTLPDAAGLEGRVYEVKNTAATSTTVQGTGGDTVDGAASKSLAQWEGARLVSDGSNWLVLADNP